VLPKVDIPTPAIVPLRPDTAFDEYFRCPDVWFDNAQIGAACEAGFFMFGEALCYGRRPDGATSRYVNGEPLPEATLEPTTGRLRLPIDLSEVVTNLRRERYRQRASSTESFTAGVSAQRMYYALRPVLGIRVRKHLQRLRLSGWESIPFPRWPVDVSVETLMQHTLALALKATGRERAPFIWFWPDGAEACVMMTHDVEGARGADYCSALMDLDESFGIPSSFQLVPTFRATAVGEEVRRRGFEVNLHDWNHDGKLFSSRDLFLERAALINEHARTLGCRGFRSAVMYRQQDWLDALEIDFDMSVPNVAHLDPQRGGCCTVMPYFVGNILELPLTTVQDYPLLHIIGDYSTTLWKRQIALVLAHHGLLSFIIHPDYVQEPRARCVYVQLLEHLRRLRGERRLWAAVPGEIATWWRQRRDLRLVGSGSSWRVEGPGAERATIAWAVLRGDRVAYELAP
jgi:hypothetical protein